MDLTNNEKLNALLSDNKSGSTDILIQLNSWLKNNITKLGNQDLYLQKIKSSLAHFQSVDTYLDDLTDLLKENNKKKLFDFFQNKKLELNSVHKRIFDNGWSYFKDVDRVITISNSHTVAQFLINLYDQKRLKEIIICESRPVMEGRLMAEKFLSKGIHVRLIIEASISAFLDVADAAIIGADKILQDGSIINKIGSRQLAILCKYFNIPLYVIADKSKFSNSDKFQQVERPDNEIWDFRHEKLKIENFYFEKIEKELIKKVISS